MLTLFKNGGFAMYFVLGFGLVALATAFWFAVRPSDVHRGFVKHMGRATLYSVLCGTCAGLATAGYYIANHPMDPDERILTAFQGGAEVMSIGILGFSILSLVSLLTAVGERRLAARESR